MMMWKKIAPLLIILSVSLNIAFISAWVMQAAKEQPSNSEPRDQACGGSACLLHRNLNVTDEQRRQLEPRLAQFKTESEIFCSDIQRLRGELIDLIASPQADSEAITLKQDQIMAGQRKMQEHVIAHLLAEKQTLTNEQQIRLFDMIRENTGCVTGNSMNITDSIRKAQSGLQSNINN